jgi:hypothetical protein
VQWVEANGTPVPASEIGGSTDAQSQLYDLSAVAAQGATA